MYIMCDNVSFVFLGFYCTPVLQQVYLGVSCLILLIGFLISVHGANGSQQATLIRQGGFASLTIFGFVPLCRKFNQFYCHCLQ
jgi:hypothetical protein